MKKKKKQRVRAAKRNLSEVGYGIDIKIDTSDMSSSDIEQLNEGIAALFEELDVDYVVKTTDKS